MMTPTAESREGDETMAGKISIRCRTNLDGFEHEEWPTSLAAVPVPGQLVQAKSGKRLKVVAVTWLYDGWLEVELHNFGGHP